jgi:dTDP-4-amino-4,6-dideoxygalactose transaminase
MNIPPLDLKRQYQTIKNEVEPALAKLYEEQTFILGEPVESFERAIAKFISTKHAISVSSGTDAIMLALMAAGITNGDEVITTPFTFIATAEPISLLGAKPVFADIDPRSYNIDPTAIKTKITKKTKAIIVVHLYGQTADMDPIRALAKEHGLVVIEDACQAIGAVYGVTGEQAGVMGEVGCFSFFPSKNLGGFGDGGLVTTENDQYAEKILKLRVHGSNKRYYHDEIGINGRLDALQAVVLKIKLKYLASWLKSREEKALKYRQLIDKKGLKDILAVPHVERNNFHTYHQYTLKLLGRNASLKKRDDLCEHLRQRGVGTMVYYPVPLHLQKCYAHLGLGKGSYPCSESCADHVFSLPIFPELTDAEQAYIIDTVAGFF